MIKVAENISAKLMASEVLLLHFILFLNYLCGLLPIGLTKGLKSKAE